MEPGTVILLKNSIVNPGTHLMKNDSRRTLLAITTILIAMKC